MQAYIYNFLLPIYNWQWESGLLYTFKTLLNRFFVRRAVRTVKGINGEVKTKAGILEVHCD